MDNLRISFAMCILGTYFLQSRFYTLTQYLSRKGGIYYNLNENCNLKEETCGVDRMKSKKQYADSAYSRKERKFLYA